ncbi:MAG TPA: BlaI/MecI/CopY family transcriptional regulator [Phycisphaerae bacterium]|nr:BlaI/MecI/CopY family transcriptional regulator [Phycisphaerae bacterium]
MAKLPRISDAEWEVMNVIWDEAPLTASEVVEALAGHRDWSPRTIKTMLNRLVRKGVLAFQSQGKRYLYRPNVTQAECVRQESQSFLERVFGGQAAPMLVQLVRSADLSADEIDQLRKILRTKKED